MSRETAKRDPNRNTSLQAISNDANLESRDLLVDPATNRLLVSAVITSGAGGTQYSDGDPRGTATGNLLMVDDGTNIQSALGTVAGVLKVDLSATTGNTVPIVVTANAGTNLNTSLLALESGGNLATLAGTVTASVIQSNIKQINGVTPLMGNGTTGTGSQRVTIASDNTPYAVKIDQTTPGTTNLVALTAETTKVIGVARTADGSGNLLTSTNNSGKQSLDVNLSGAANVTINTSPGYNAPAAGSISSGSGSTASYSLATQQYTTVVAELSGTFSGTVVFEQQFQSTGAWYKCFGTPIIGSQALAVTSVVLAGSPITPVAYQFTAGTGINFRVTTLASEGGSYTSGTLTVFLAETTDNLQFGQNIAVVGTPTVNLSQVGGTSVVTGGTAGTQSVGGIVANNGTINSAVNPVLIAGQAVSSENSANTTAKLSQFVTDLVGKQIVLPYANPENFVNGTTAAITDTTSTSTIASAGGSLRNYVTTIAITNSHATVGTFVKVLDGASIIWEEYAAAAGGGFNIKIDPPLRGTAATAVNVQCVTTGANVIASISAYKGI